MSIGIGSSYNEDCGCVQYTDEDFVKIAAGVIYSEFNRLKDVYKTIEGIRREMVTIKNDIKDLSRNVDVVMTSIVEENIDSDYGKEKKKIKADEEINRWKQLVEYFDYCIVHKKVDGDTIKGVNDYIHNITDPIFSKILKG